MKRSIQGFRAMAAITALASGAAWAALGAQADTRPTLAVMSFSNGALSHEAKVAVGGSGGRISPFDSSSFALASSAGLPWLNKSCFKKDNTASDFCFSAMARASLRSASRF